MLFRSPVESVIVLRTTAGNGRTPGIGADDVAAVTTHDVGRAFGGLKPRERDVLWFAYVECFDHKEIAGILQVGIASIRPMLARARAKFADILRQRGISE